MKIFIVEDEKVALRRLVRQVQEVLSDSEISVFCEIDDALNAFKTQTPDLLILDLNLNGEDGFKILSSVGDREFHKIVVSANGDRALEGFNWGIVDFVLKPYESERFVLALKRFIGQRNRQKGGKEILIKEGTKRFTVSTDDIICICGAGDYREIYCKNGKLYLHVRSLEKFEEILPDNFVRIHNSYLVDKNHIVETTVCGGGKYTAVLSNGRQLPVSRSKYKELFGETD